MGRFDDEALAGQHSPPARGGSIRRRGRGSGAGAARGPAGARGAGGGRGAPRAGAGPCAPSSERGRAGAPPRTMREGRGGCPRGGPQWRGAGVRPGARDGPPQHFAGGPAGGGASPRAAPFVPRGRPRQFKCFRLIFARVPGSCSQVFLPKGKFGVDRSSGSHACRAIAARRSVARLSGCILPGETGFHWEQKRLCMPKVSRA